MQTSTYDENELPVTFHDAGSVSGEQLFSMLMVPRVLFIRQRHGSIPCVLFVKVKHTAALYRFMKRHPNRW